ncbi:MAG: GTPase HflX [Bacteroidota bacterium]
MYDVDLNPEKAIAVSAVKKGSDRELALEHLDELAFLADTAGAEVIEKIYQELEKPNPATVVGKGKLEEIKQEIEDEGISLVIFDEELSPAQTRNLENKLKIKVMDRSSLILDIFARRAKTNEAIVQVELAQLQYLLPRLTRMWTHLSKQYGGIGTKGPGETQIESDRRMIRTRIQLLKEKLSEIEMQKFQQRKNRSQMPRFALVGYTNAGKSTLMNAVTESEVYIEDKLFATLDTTVRAFALPNGKKVLLSDTVGFIRKLPAHLVASFRSTLAEAKEADVLLHVVDVSHKYFPEHIRVVNQTLESLKIDLPTLLVFNKVDKVSDPDDLRAIEREYDDSIFISAKRGINLNALLETMQNKYDERTSDFEILLPYSDMELSNIIYNNYEIENREDKDEGAYFRLRVAHDDLEFFKNKFSKYITE